VSELYMLIDHSANENFLQQFFYFHSQSSHYGQKNRFSTHFSL